MARYAAFGLGLLLIMATLLTANGAVAGSGAKDGKQNLQQVVMSVSVNRRMLAIGGQRTLQQTTPGTYTNVFGPSATNFLTGIGAPGFGRH